MNQLNIFVQLSFCKAVIRLRVRKSVSRTPGSGLIFISQLQFWDPNINTIYKFWRRFFFLGRWSHFRAERAPNHQRADSRRHCLRPGQKEGGGGVQRSHFRLGRRHLWCLHPDHRGGHLRGQVHCRRWVTQSHWLIFICQRQCCGSGTFIPDPDFTHPGFRIQKQQQKRGVKKIVFAPFF